MKTVQFLNMLYKWMDFLDMILLNVIILKFLIETILFTQLVLVIKFLTILQENKKSSTV
jgi:hypothetical protein